MDIWDIPFRYDSGRSYPWRRCISKVERTIARFLFRFVDLFLLVPLPDHEFAEFGVPMRKILPLNNAIWLDSEIRELPKKNNSRNDHFTILCMRSRFSQDMGLDLLSQAFNTLNKIHPDVELRIIGQIPDEIRPQITLLEGHTNVCFREFVEHDELMSLAASSSACVVPFRNTKEYLSCGAVVLAPDLPGIATMIKHGENGLLFRPDDSADLAEKLCFLYEHPEYVCRISQRAKALREEFDCRNKAKTILDAIEKICLKDEPEPVREFQRK